ncbi:hypothetical protein N9T15_01300 [Pelagibacteraceae bacterium]|nr:hypothetical protein [Pelagibacteraceae bacterium]
MIFNILKISKITLFLIITLNINNGISEEINACIKNAVSNNIKYNKILTLCRENINTVNVYNNAYEVKKFDKDSSYISTNKTNEIIHEMIQNGQLAKAGRLAERQEIEKTKRIKARAEAEALKAPQIIATNTTSSNNAASNANVRSVLSLGANPIASILAGSKILEVTTPAAHGAIPGQFVTIKNVNSSLDGISASEINRTHIISSVPSISTFRISVLSSASTGSISGGGTDIVATFQN